MSPDLVIVLGCHRSGTSLAAKTAEVLGCYAGDRLMPGNA